MNVATHAVVNITKNVKTSFVDRESDFTVKQLPPFGVAGWTKDDEDVILYDKFDLWRISPDGAQPVQADRRSGRADPLPVCPARSGRRVHRSRKAVVPEPVRNLDARSRDTRGRV